MSNRLLLPVRIDFIGGWTDQAVWYGPAAVLNASVGWVHTGDSSPYPLWIDERQTVSEVAGVGTGLGISSILAAGRHILQFGRDGYREAVDAEERRLGVQGGWQDAIGAIEPGMKIVAENVTTYLRVVESDNILSHVLLFDTGVRRNSGVIGAKVRALIERRHLQTEWVLSRAAESAVSMPMHQPRWFAEECLSVWRRLCELVPEMRPPVGIPACRGMIGWKMCGAGGGGFGMAFLEQPNHRKEVARCLESSGLKTYRPVLLGGAQYSLAGVSTSSTPITCDSSGMRDGSGVT